MSSCCSSHVELTICDVILRIHALIFIVCDNGTLFALLRIGRTVEMDAIVVCEDKCHCREKAAKSLLCLPRIPAC